MTNLEVKERSILIQNRYKSMQGHLRIQETRALDLSIAVARKCFYYRVRTTSLSPRTLELSTPYQSWTKDEQEEGMHKHYKKTRTYCTKQNKVLCLFLLSTYSFEHPSLKKKEEPACLAPFLLEAPFSLLSTEDEQKGGIQ